MGNTLFPHFRLQSYEKNKTLFTLHLIFSPILLTEAEKNCTFARNMEEQQKIPASAAATPSGVRLQRQIILPNDVQEVPRLAEFVEAVCDEAGVDMLTTMQLNLALEEAVVNVMNYAYPAGTQGDVRLAVQVEGDTLTFVLSDSGTPFDPTAKEDADTTLSAEERPIGGLGILLVKQLMDTVAYQRADGQNILTLTKKLGESPL